MSVTEQDIQNLTPEHRVVWKEPGAPREVELGLWVDEKGDLYTDAGHAVLWKGGPVTGSAMECIVRIIEPAFTLRRGMVIGQPDVEYCRLVHMGGGYMPWLGYAPEFGDRGDWYTNDGARILIERYGWVVVDDLTKEKSND